MEKECIEDLRWNATVLLNIFDFKTENRLNQEISSGNIRAFDRRLQKMLSPANKLMFITTKDNHRYATEIFKTIQKVFNDGNKIISTTKLIKDMSNLVLKEMKNILDYLFLIEGNKEEFKDFIFEEENHFDEILFLNVAKKIRVVNRNKNEKIKIFQEELNGGSFIKEIQRTLGLSDEEVELYGIDTNIDVGVKSRKKGINTARGGLMACSKNWADIAISTNNKIDFSDVSFLDYAFEKTMDRRLLQRGGIYIFNIPFYELSKVKNKIGRYEILSILNTGDKYGNLIFILKNILRKPEKNENLLRQAEFMPQTLPRELKKEITIHLKPTEPPKNFRANYVDMEDIKDEFMDIPPSSEFIFDHFYLDEELEIGGKSLQEPKEGHIPTYVTSGAVSGRYVDETLYPLLGEKIGFDNLIEAKVIKREVESQERVNHDGEIVEEISLKKSNVIVISLLTALGEYIELFNNNNDTDKK